MCLLLCDQPSQQVHNGLFKVMPVPHPARNASNPAEGRRTAITSRATDVTFMSRVYITLPTTIGHAQIGWFGMTS